MRTKQGGPLEYFVFLQGFTGAHAMGIGYREECIWYAFQRARELIGEELSQLEGRVSSPRR
ncbi:hypothetical protein [Amycolatopsis sp. NPDC051372]|uniref:hypothetical protein n=1 Tax=Amycolatopsis sp. NPDC051372 TaxID=3155669 RepID=UPI00342628A8